MIRRACNPKTNLQVKQGTIEPMELNSSIYSFNVMYEFKLYVIKQFPMIESLSIQSFLVNYSQKKFLIDMINFVT